MKIAIVGGGIAGLGAAWALNRSHDITLFEADARLGGHAHTVDVVMGNEVVPVDTGFLVYNETTYPHLTRLFAHAAVATQPSDMSFSFTSETGLEYAGSAAGFFAQGRNLVRPRHWRMASDIIRFRRLGPDMLANADDGPLGDLLDHYGFSVAFQDDYLLPMAAAIWSARMREIRRFPARTFLQFFANHGLISITDRPQWRTVTGGSRRYVAAVSEPFRNQVRLDAPVISVDRHTDGVLVRTADSSSQTFDHVVLATHSDQTLAILGSRATIQERQVLGALRYEHNRAVLHRDISLMPRRRRVWSSWNYRTSPDDRDIHQATVTYWLNRLQSLPQHDPLLLTLNPIIEPDPALIIDEYAYSHPQFDQAARVAQRRIAELQGTNRTWFAGAYTGFGFHEDGLQSGLNVAAALGSPAPWDGHVTSFSTARASVRLPA